MRAAGLGRAFVVSIFAAIVLVTLNFSSLAANVDDNGYTVLGVQWTWLLGLPIWLGGCLVAEHLERLPEPRGLWFWRGGLYAISCLLLAAKFHAGTPWASYTITLSLFAVPVVWWLGLETKAGLTREPGTTDKLGKAAYSLYLAHPLVAAASPNLPVYVLAVISATTALYFAIEKRFHKLARKAGRRLARQG
jgi:peptidoglycan/LPS O-acetylase OafA/YrhL